MRTRKTKIKKIKEEKRRLNWSKTVNLIGRKKAGEILSAAKEKKENVLDLLQYIKEVLTPDLVVDFENAKRVSKFFFLKEVKRIYQEEDYFFFIE